MYKKIMILIAIFLLGLFSNACKGENIQLATVDPNELGTKVAEEVAVQLTQIAINQPTVTLTSPPVVQNTEVPTPTDTLVPPTEALPTLESASPTASASPTNTVPAAAPTQKPTSTATPTAFACQLVKQVPKDEKTFKPGDDFDAVWTVKNTGAEVWVSNDVDFQYEDGAELHKSASYDLAKDVKPGESIDLTADMVAPDKEGTYKTTWRLYRGSRLICTLTLKINVEN